MKEIKLTLFANSTPEGQELASLLKKLFASEFPGGLKVQMETITDGDDGDMIVAGFRDDIVIFDGSVEDDIGSNYKAVRMWPLCMDHFLVVSRTRLPINFQPFHEGGSPDTWGDVLARHYDEHPIFGKCPPPKIFICKPTKSEGLVVREADSEFIRKLDDKVARELGRCLANTNYYEQIRSQQKLKKLPVALQWFNFQSGKLSQRILAAVGGYSPLSKQEWQKANFKEYQSLLKSRPFSDEFWNDRIVTCPNCTSQNKTNKNFNFQDFLRHSHNGQFRISSEDLNAILMSGMWRCNKCGYEFKIIEESHPQFRWWSIKWNRPTGPNNVFVEQISLYSLHKI